MAAVVGSVYTQEGTNTAHSVSITAVTSGNALMFWLRASAAPSSFTDSESGVYTLRHTLLASGINYYLYDRLNITDAPTTVNINYAASTFISVFGFEASDIDSFDTAADGDTGTFTATPSASATAAGDNSLGFFCLRLGVNRTWTDPSGWTRINPQGASPSNRGGYYNEDLGAAGVKTCAPTLDTGTNPYSALAIYNDAGGGGGGGGIVPILTGQRRRRGRFAGGPAQPGSAHGMRYERSAGGVLMPKERRIQIARAA